MHQGNQEEIERVFDALGNARRRAILALLAIEPLSSAKLAAGFDCSWQAISKHLKVLREADLVGRYDFEDDGHPLYVASGRGVQIAQEWLRDLE